MAMNLFWICAIGIVAAMVGFWSGRLSLLLGSAESEPLLATGAENTGEEGFPSAKMENLGEGGILGAGMQSAGMGNSGERGFSGVGMQSAGMENFGERGLFAAAEMPDMDMEKMPADRKRFEAEPKGQIRGISPDLDPRVQKGGLLREKSTVDKGGMLGRAWLGRRPSNEKRIPLGWAIGSPVEGAVHTFHNGSAKGAMVRTTMGCLYAPASGKIVRLYPSGNQMLLRTDFGIELLIRVGGINGGYQAAQTEEMMGEYFRPRVLQNEIVNKGKLLLEYDREALLAAGADTDIFIGVEESENFRDITVTDKIQVKRGEEILWIVDHSRIVAN